MSDSPEVDAIVAEMAAAGLVMLAAMLRAGRRGHSPLRVPTELKAEANG
jgi:hypothetical protein